MVNDFKESPVFICGHRKTGTTLLLALLDGHPELSVYPVDSSFFYRYFPIYDSDKYTDEEKINAMVDKIIESSIAEHLRELSEEDAKNINFDIELFKKDFLEFAKKTQVTPKDMLISLALAFQVQ